jgi:hypothetical protein
LPTETLRYIANPSTVTIPLYDHLDDGLFEIGWDKAIRYVNGSASVRRRKGINPRVSVAAKAILALGWIARHRR